ncbi:hypothetical protein RDI58_021580 [Solanum bulbocastanum]|uniref:Uncharacterized protein n=1 Tax=Solanum bulbocastanum TaxID=147425 RepID=A0AAN8Y5A9_SOLBU
MHHSTMVVYHYTSSTASIANSHAKNVPPPPPPSPQSPPSSSLGLFPPCVSKEATPTVDTEILGRSHPLSQCSF